MRQLSVLAVTLLCTSASAQVRLVEVNRLSPDIPVSRITVSPSGRIYFVSRSTNQNGWVDDRTGRVTAVGGSGWGQDALDEPTGIALEALSVFVSDRNNQRVVRYDRDLRPVSELRTVDTTYVPARFAYPAGIAVNRRGDMGVLDGDSRELVVFDNTGRFLFRFGRDPRNGVVLRDPVDICVDGSGRWVILDRTMLVEVDEFGTLVYREELRENEQRAVDARSGWTVTADRDGLLLHTSDHRTHQSMPLTSFYLESSTAILRDLTMVDRGIVMVIDGEIVRYSIEGFTR